jgi:hypothetical protein
MQCQTAFYRAPTRPFGLHCSRVLRGDQNAAAIFRTHETILEFFGQVLGAILVRGARVPLHARGLPLVDPGELLLQGVWCAIVLLLERMHEHPGAALGRVRPDSRLLKNAIREVIAIPPGF